MQRGHLTPTVHLLGREIADTESQNFSLLPQSKQRFSSFFNRHQRIRPMDLVDINAIGLQSTQGILDLFLNPSRRRIAKYFAIIRPLEGDFGCQNRTISATPFCQRLADDFLGSPKAVHRRGIDEIDTLIDYYLDRGNRFCFVRAAPERTTDRPGTKTNARDRRGNIRTTNRFCNHKMDYSFFEDCP